MKHSFILPLFVCAQESAGRSLGSLFMATGFVGLLLVLAGALALVLAIRRWIELWPARLAPESLQKSVELELREGQLDKALKLALASRTFLGEVVAAGLYLRAGGLDEMLANVERETAKQLLVRGNRVANLARCGGIILLAGFFGTVVSLMNALVVLGAMKSPEVGDFVRGIGESLVSTALALFIGLFCFGFFFALDSKLTQRGLRVRAIAEEMIRDAAERARPA